LDSPPFNKSLMDGYAVISQDVAAGKRFRIRERITAGEVPNQPIRSGETTQIMTGAKLPEGADAVVRIEDATEVDSDHVEFGINSIASGRNVMFLGESMRAGEILFHAGERIQFPHLALLAENGNSRVSVFRQPEVAILATGDELVEIDQVPQDGQIRNSNEAMLTAQCQHLGVKVRPLGIARDNFQELVEKIQTGLTADFLLLSGGVSAGVLDLVPRALQELGVQQVFHKVEVKPGKPIWFGIRPGSDQALPCYVFGLPGNPVSSLVCFEVFVRRAIEKYEGLTWREQGEGLAALKEVYLAKGDRPVYYPARIWREQDQWCCRPLRWMGSADLRGAAMANGLILFSPREKPYQLDERVPVISWFDRPND
ncbi:MAG: molybdopterin molybdotransferase MoeA, partial [Planctomycetaceae bacterium]|nr:molybdopterin molybdotransferase MoeA [Planctomycetaceae bacterium]